MKKRILNKKTLLLIGGYPGTGKTFLAHKILEKISLVYLNKDILNDVYGKSRLTNEYTENKDKVLESIYAITISNLQVGNSVLIDAPLSSNFFGNQQWIKYISNIAKNNNTYIKVIWCIASLKTRRKRIIQRHTLRDQERFHEIDNFIAREKIFNIPFPYITFNTEKDTINKAIQFIEYDKSQKI